jgi:NADH-quinone oxidoreductase subunit J
MTGQEVAFLVLAVVGGLGALLVVTSRSVVHAALYLVVALASVAGAYLVMAAPFIAFVQVIIYVGAIVVLLLFGIMLTKAPVGRRVLDNTPRARLGAAVVGGAVFAMLTWFMVQAFSGERLDPAAATTLQALGTSIFRNFVLPFEAVSVLLLAALIGAIVLSRRDSSEDADAPPPDAGAEELRADQRAGR